MDPKIRDRTYDELLVRKKEFLKICNILDQLNIIFFFKLWHTFGGHKR